MDRTFVPEDVKVKRSKVGNMDPARLFRRRTFLIRSTLLNSRDFESRVEWAFKVCELCAIEDELQRRGLLHESQRRIRPDPNIRS